MATIYINGQAYEVKDGQNLLHCVLSLGFNLPFFCWHPALGSVGACRQCAVKQFKDENDTKGKIVMACMTPALPNTRISIDDPEARQFRASVIEWLMVNHPHDCPVCDEGGECHLQDMTWMTGHTYRKYRFAKRTWRNQYLGPFINHEMNRCIACYRCVRYYRDYADGRDFDVFGVHDRVYFGRHADGVLENEFSGNLVEVCPTGVFTDKTLGKHYTRKWDLQTAPSICVHCSVGCNTIPGERYGYLRRIRNRYNHQVNGYFLCDRGRYGYEFANLPQRIREPLLRTNAGEPLRAVTAEQALNHIRSLLADKSKVIGIGSPRASLEANFALWSLVGAEHFFHGVPAAMAELVATALEILRQGPAPSATLQDLNLADAVLVLGEDSINYAPMQALALRQAARREPMKAAAKLKIADWHAAAVSEVIQEAKGPFYVATPTATRLDGAARATYRAAPDDLARFGFAIAELLHPQAPKVPNLPPQTQALAREIADALKGAEHPVVVSGTGCASVSILQATANIAWALRAAGRPAQISLSLPECNSFGLGLMGGKPLESALQAVEKGQADTVIILENDLFRSADPDRVNALLRSARHVVVLEHIPTRTSESAEVVLPSAIFAETSGTFVNYEGRAQRFFQVYLPGGALQSSLIKTSWRWLRDCMSAPWKDLDDVIAALSGALPAFTPVRRAAPGADFRLVGRKIPREPHRYSGRTAMLANITVHEPQTPKDPDSPLAFTMEGFEGRPPAPLIPRFWWPGWNSVQSLSRFQEEVGGSLIGGESGCRLVEPNPQEPTQYFAQIPPAFQRRPGQWLLVPCYHIFGSEELSALAAGIAQLVPKPYLALNVEDAQAIGAGEGDELTVRLDAQVYRLPLKIQSGLPSGLAGLPVGLPQGPTLALPAWGKVSKGGLNG